MRKSLGRGLDALIPTKRAPVAEAPPTELAPAPSPTTLAIGEIVPNPDQPRQVFGEEALVELTASVKQHGILQPLVVRKTPVGYELIAGERRLRAATRAGLERVPVVVRGTEDGERLELALIENVQRADLNPLEEAAAYRRLAEEYGLTQDEIARQVGKGRSTIANTMRLASLPEPIKQMLRSGELTGGHARAVLAIEGEQAQIAFARELVSGKATKAEAERRVQQRKPVRPGKAAPRLTIDIHLRALADDLTKGLGTRVRIVRKPKGGVIEIEFYSDAELDRLADQLRLSASTRDALL